MPGEREAAPADRPGTIESTHTDSELADTVADRRSDAAPSDHRPSAGSRIGRYVVLEPIGRGGMGEVYRAFDPQLDRDIALKLAPGGRGSPRHRSRLLREAQALARLAHPNVVPVFDVITRGDDVFIAMELVEGRTLREIVQQDPPPAPRILELYTAAGRGLAAAHAAGLVHRDFKPDNVVVGDDGRVRVLDFGLAKSSKEASSEAVSPASPAGATSILAAPLTQTGAVVGTPTYMAPEQLGGGAVDARADQFAFAASLYEALHGRPPPRGDAATAAEAPLDPSLPAGTARAIARGLSSDPDARFPDMDGLLAALAPPEDARRRRRRVVAFTAATLAAGGVIALGAARLAGGGGPASDLCRGAEAHLAGAWDPAARGSLVASLGRVAGADPAAVQRVARAIDGYAAGWTAMWTDSCLATRVRGEQSDRLHDLRSACLDRQRDKLAALVGVLAGRSGEVSPDRAADAVAALSPVATCADTTSLLRGVPAPRDPAAAAALPALRRRIDEAEARERAALYRTGADRIAAVVADAQALDHAPVLAEALYQQGSLLTELRDGKAAEPVVRRALVVASAARDAGLEARAAILLVYVIGNLLGRSAEALSLADFAAAAVARAGQEGELASDLHRVIAALHQTDGKTDLARAELEKALASWPARLGPEHPKALAIAHDLAIAYLNLDLFPQSIASSRRALEGYERLFGPDHPRVAKARHVLAGAVWASGDPEQARALLESSVAIYQRHLGDHPDLARALATLGQVLADLDLGDEAEAALRRSVAIMEKTLGHDHIDVAHSLRTLAGVLDVEELAEAERYLERALAIDRRALGEKHHYVVADLYALGEARLVAGRYPGAWTAYDRARAIVEEAGDDQGQIADLSDALGRVELARGRPRDAVRLFTRATSLYERIGAGSSTYGQALVNLASAEIALGQLAAAEVTIERMVAQWTSDPAAVPPAKRATLRMQLAEAMWGPTAVRRRRARELATSAQGDLAGESGSDQGELRGEIERWLAAHAGPASPPPRCSLGWDEEREALPPAIALTPWPAAAIPEECPAGFDPPEALASCAPPDCVSGLLAPGRPAALVVEGPEGSGRFFALGLAVGGSATRFACIQGSTVGWRHFAGQPAARTLAPLPWLSDLDSDGAAELIVWHRVNWGSSEIDNGLVPAIFRFDGGAVLVRRDATGALLARRVAAAYRSFIASPAGSAAAPGPASCYAALAVALDRWGSR